MLFPVFILFNVGALALALLVDKPYILPWERVVGVCGVGLFTIIGIWIYRASRRIPIPTSISFAANFWPVGVLV